MEALNNIINQTIKKPTIVNINSKFVVITYWWGGNAINNNTARPCIAFFQDFTNKVIKYTLNFFITLLTQQNRIQITNSQQLMDNFIKHISITNTFNDLMLKKAIDYFYLMYEYFDLLKYNKQPDLQRSELIRLLAEGKSRGNILPEFNLEPIENVVRDFKEIMLNVIDINKENILNLFLVNKDMKTLKNIFFEERESLSQSEKEGTIEQTKELLLKKKQFNELITKELSKKQSFNMFGTTIEKVNIYDILNTRFRFVRPLTFQQMIDKWEATCVSQNCNYLSVEYTFGDYQMAINAKPYFIRKALDLCGARNVIYIDGDMLIKKYPAIFDMPNVDFMARGWWVDPRSSYNIGTSILYDPYVFETSGGTMFYSQSLESKQLLQAWMDESKEPRQDKKADDRILSLIFNTKKFLLNVNVIQLPIEYLWLTLDYDQRMLEHVYDWDAKEMQESIFIEHPECLTSEESASGAGASSDRSPKFYNFLYADETFIPVSEEEHEYIMFPNQEMTKAFSSYHTYMKGAHYINDGNPLLVELGLVTPGQPTEDNAQPLYITNYASKYGKRQKTVDNNIKIVNEELNSAFFNNPQNNIKLVPNAFGFIELEGAIFDRIGEEYQISMILSLLSKGYNIIYKPTGFLPQSYVEILTRKDTNLELVFFPIMKEMTNILKPCIDLSQPILFHAPKQNTGSRSSSPQNIYTQFGSFEQRPDVNTYKDSMLFMILSMFTTFQELSDYLTYGSYQTMSRVRIGYAFNKKNLSRPSTPIKDMVGQAAGTVGQTVGQTVGHQMQRHQMQRHHKKFNRFRGGNVLKKLDENDEDKFIREYEEGLQMMYGGRSGFRKKNNRKKRKTVKRRKTRTTNKMIKKRRNTRNTRKR